MPDMDTSPSGPRARASSKYPELRPYEAALIDQQAEMTHAVLDELRGIRRDVTRAVLLGGTGTLVVILFLVSGILLIRGEDPRQAASATRDVAEVIRPGDAPAGPGE